MSKLSALELADAYKQSEIGPDDGVLYRLGTALRQVTTPDKTGLSNMDRVAIKKSTEVKEIKVEYTDFRGKTHYRDMKVDSIESLLERMRKYPITFEKGIKDLEGCLEQKRRDALKISWC
jgi:hypothetical protein